MKRRTSTWIISLVAFICPLILLSAYFISSNKINYKYNSFERSFSLEPLTLSAYQDLKYNSFYIAGISKQHLYFGNILEPSRVLITNHLLADTQHIKINIKNANHFKYYSIKLSVDSPNFYLSDGRIPVILKGNLSNWYALPFIDDGKYFIECVPFSNSSFAIRTTDPNTHNLILGKMTHLPPFYKAAPHLLEKQIDGKFCTDGMLHYSTDLGWLVYIYYYRNQFICLDTGMNLLYRGNTIDTISKAKITMAQVKSNKSVTVSTPPLVVNKKTCVSNNLLFVNSNLLAKNENKKEFEGASVIDVYNLKRGDYQFSFYIPNFRGKKMKSFKVINNKLICMYNQYAVVYQLNSKVLASKNLRVNR